jgi:hypothetical protein
MAINAVSNVASNPVSIEIYEPGMESFPNSGLRQITTLRVLYISADSSQCDLSSDSTPAQKEYILHE